LQRVAREILRALLGYMGEQPNIGRRDLPALRIRRKDHGMRQLGEIIGVRLGELIKSALQGFGFGSGLIAAWMIWNGVAQWVFA